MRLAGTLLCAISLIGSYGCSQSNEVADPPSQAAKSQPTAKKATSNKPSAEPTANEILTRLLATYRQAKTYQDQGVIRLVSSKRSTGRRRATCRSVERPPGFRCGVPGHRQSDGRELKPVSKTSTSNVDNQVVAARSQSNFLTWPPIRLRDISSRLRCQPIQLECSSNRAACVSLAPTPLPLAGRQLSRRPLRLKWLRRAAC
jgi:hypothetical protein